jgi:hypothetical protein
MHKAYTAGAVTEAQATELSDLIEARGPVPSQPRIPFGVIEIGFIRLVGGGIGKVERFMPRME